MSRETMQMALDALYENTSYSINGDPLTYQDERNDDTIEALRVALAQPEKEWAGLTDEEIYTVENEYVVDYRIPAGCAWNFARDIEEKLKEKNGY